MITRQALIQYLDQLLMPQHFSDYGPNGLQVEGAAEISTIITGVSACSALIDAAIEKKADTILVHHGFLWQKDNPRIIGVKQRRLKALLENKMNLIAYHLPLDAHAQYGNNVQLAHLLGIAVDKRALQDTLLFTGKLKTVVSGRLFQQHIAKTLHREPLYIPGASQDIHTVAWCTGGGADMIDEAIDAKADAFITGEIYERTVPIARESGIHLYGAGHHATERYGVKALGEHLANHFDLSVEFVDIDNPV